MFTEWYEGLSDNLFQSYVSVAVALALGALYGLYLGITGK